VAAGLVKPVQTKSHSAIDTFTKLLVTDWTQPYARNKLGLFPINQGQSMENCYRSTPKLVGAFFDALYQHPTMLMTSVAGLSLLAAAWWYKSGNNPE